jgi:hypothetical protein
MDTNSVPQRGHLRDGNPIGSERYMAVTTTTESTIEPITYASRIMATILFLIGVWKAIGVPMEVQLEDDGLSKGMEFSDWRELLIE